MLINAISLLVLVSCADCIANVYLRYKRSAISLNALPHFSRVFQAIPTALENFATYPDLACLGRLLG